MNPSGLLYAALVLSCVPGQAAPPDAAPAPGASSPFTAADQKLIDRYTGALRDKFGFSSWKLENGALAVAGPAGKFVVEINDARSEEDIEAKALKTLPQLEKKEAGESKTPVYFAGAGIDELFKGAVVAADSKDADAGLAAKAEANDFKALLDLKQGKILFPGHTQPEIVFNVNGKPARRVVIRRDADGGFLVATLEGDDYAYAVARVRAGGKSERDPVKTGGASVFFEVNAWMQKANKDADLRGQAANYAKLSDAGSKHPAFEKLMAQVRGGLTTENLDKAFENSGAQAPADLAARAQAARELAASDYGGAAHWKINSNGKYADANGNLTLLVRANGAAKPGGKIEETPILVKRNASGGYDLAAAAGPVTQLLLNGDVVGARAKAFQTAASATPAEVVSEVVKKPAAVFGPDALGFTGTVALRGVAAEEFALRGVPAEDIGLRGVPPDAALRGVMTRSAAAAKKEAAIVRSACEGKPDCAPTAPIVRTEEAPAKVIVAPQPRNVVCAISVELTSEQKTAIEQSAELPSWAGARPHFSGKEGDDSYATAADCVFGIGNRGLERPVAESRARMRLAQLVGCNPTGAVTLNGSVPTAFVHFQTKDGRPAACAEVRMKVRS